MKAYPVIVALDGIPVVRALQIARLLKGQVWGFKVHELAIRDGFKIVKKLKRYGKVFVDLKLHDIPTTVAHEVEALSALGADLISVHAAGGREMLEAAVRSGGSKIVAVTVLTSLPKSEARRVPALASLARTAGVRALVCSPHEAPALKKLYPSVTLITPGIREQSDKKEDQVRVATPKVALQNGASLLVIGRPITEAKAPLDVLLKLVEAL